MTKPLDDKVILITGATDGIGKLTALKLAGQKARLIIHGRNENKLSNVVKELKSKTDNNNIDEITADFTSLAEVRKMAEEIKSSYSNLDVLINNAGAGFSDPRYSKEGYELRFTVNYLAPFLLTQLLLPCLVDSPPSRIVNVSSVGQHKIDFNDIMMEKHFDPVRAYSQSKLALIMYTFELAERMREMKVTVNALHPGTYLDTNMVRNAGIKPWGNPDTGADAVFFLADSESLNGVTGKYFNVKKEAKADSQAYDQDARKKLWELSLKLTNLNQEVVK